MPRSWTPAGRPRPCPLRPFGVVGSGHWTPSPPALCVSRLIRFREVRSLPCGLQDSLCTLRLCRSVLRASFIIATLGIGRVVNPCQRPHYRSASLPDCADSDSRDSHPQKRAASPGAPNVAENVNDQRAVPLFWKIQAVLLPWCESFTDREMKN